MPVTNAVKTTSITLPSSVSNEIIQKVQEKSAVMSLARSMPVTGRGTTIPIILDDPEAAWVGETEKKPVSKPTLDTKMLQPYTLAVIVPFSNQFRNNAPALYSAIVSRLPGALAKKFDNTVFGGTSAPGSNFDTFASIQAQNLDAGEYKALVEADTDIADHDGITNGYVISPKAKGLLLSAVDADGRPLFINSVAEGAIPMILGSPVKQAKAAFISGSPNTLGFVGDWTQAIYGISQALSLSISDQATLTVGDETINLWQQNMFAVRAEIEVGFRADLSVFNKLTSAK